MENWKWYLVDCEIPFDVDKIKSISFLEILNNFDQPSYTINNGNQWKQFNISWHYDSQRWKETKPGWYLKSKLFEPTQPAFTCSESTMETLEQCTKSVQR